MRKLTTDRQIATRRKAWSSMGEARDDKKYIMMGTLQICLDESRKEVDGKSDD